MTQHPLRRLQNGKIYSLLPDLDAAASGFTEFLLLVIQLTHAASLILLSGSIRVLIRLLMCCSINNRYLFLIIPAASERSNGQLHGKVTNSA